MCVCVSPYLIYLTLVIGKPQKKVSQSLFELGYLAAQRHCEYTCITLKIYMYIDLIDLSVSFEREYVAARRYANYMHCAEGMYKCRQIWFIWLFWAGIPGSTKILQKYMHRTEGIYEYRPIWFVWLFLAGIPGSTKTCEYTYIALEVYMNVDIFDLSGCFEVGYLAARRHCGTERGASRPLLRWRSTPSPLACCSVLQLVAVCCSAL